MLLPYEFIYNVTPQPRTVGVRSQPDVVPIRLKLGGLIEPYLLISLQWSRSGTVHSLRGTGRRTGDRNSITPN
jgi:hypothetical protein